MNLTPKEKEILKKISEKKEREEYLKACREAGVCPKCGNKIYTLTEYNEARCSFQSLVDNRIFCPFCDTKDPESVMIYLNNPVTSCSDCRHKGYECIYKKLELDYDSSDDHTSRWGGAGPDCTIVRGEPA
mgnify:CR=1 FL=1